MRTWRLLVITGLVFGAGVGAQPQPPMRSKITIYNLKDKSSQVIFTADAIFEAPNWSQDGKFLLVNTGGDLYRLPVSGSQPTESRII